MEEYKLLYHEQCTHSRLEYHIITLLLYHYYIMNLCNSHSHIDFYGQQMPFFTLFY